MTNNLRKNSDEVLLNYKTEKYGLDKTIQELRKIKLSFPEKEWYYKGFENSERQMSSHIADLTLEVKELKQQLAEKEEQLNSAKVGEKFALKCCSEARELLAEKDKKQERTNKVVEQFQQRVKYFSEKDQYKIEFAVAELEKMKETMLDNAWRMDSHWECAFEFIDNQIKELKEGK